MNNQTKQLSKEVIDDLGRQLWYGCIKVYRKKHESEPLILWEDLPESIKVNHRHLARKVAVAVCKLFDIKVVEENTGLIDSVNSTDHVMELGRHLWDGCNEVYGEKYKSQPLTPWEGVPESVKVNYRHLARKIAVATFKLFEIEVVEENAN
jgi:hypothetical protein